MNNWTVYKHTFPNNKVYIGITSRTPDERWGTNGQNYRIEQPAMYYAIKKYGWENVAHEILYTNLSKEEAKTKEIELIEYYNSYIHAKNSNGYNMTKGGDMVGYILSDEQIQNIINLYSQGYTCTQISQQLGHDKNTVSNILKKNNFNIEPYHKRINQFDLQGNYIATYESAREAERQTKINYKLISGCVTGKARQTHNYQWRYYNEKDLNGIRALELSKKRDKQKTAVQQFDLDNNFIAEYESLKEAQNQTGVNQRDISACIKRPHGTSGGFIWKRRPEN